MRQRKINRTILFFVILFIALIFMYPLAIVFFNSVKPLSDIVAYPLSLPKGIEIQNFINTWEIMEIPKIVKNTAIITVLAVAGICLLATMTSYWTVRYDTLFARIFTTAMMLSMLVPFAAIMLPEVQVLRVTGMVNTLHGSVFVYWGVGMAFAFFIIQSAVKGVPLELEEAGMIDGCTRTRIFFVIVLPLLKPAIITVAVMDMFWIWNDFIVPLITLNNMDQSTIQLAISRLFGQYSSKWDIALPALVMTLLPVLIVFVIFQKRIVGGVMAGAVKG